MTYFKLNKRIVTDMYIFDADCWYELGGDFLCDPSKEEFEGFLSEEGINPSSLIIDYK